MKRVILATIFVLGCSNADKNDEFLSKAKKASVIFNKDEPAYCLEKWSSLYPKWECLAIVFGFGDDFSVCKEMASHISSPSLNSATEYEYRCVPLVRE